MPQAPQCSVEKLASLLVSWHSWRDAPPYALVAQSLEANPKLVVMLLRLCTLYNLLARQAGLREYL